MIMSLICSFSLMGIFLIESKCGVRELHHVLWGHLTPILGTGLIALVSIISWKRFRVTPSSRGGGTL